MTESDYLGRQQAEARAAMSGVVADMKQALSQGVSLRQWTKEHPIILMGAAAAVGVAAGVLLTPSKEESFKEFFEEKWEAIKDKLTPQAPAQGVAAAAPAQPAAEQPSILKTIIGEAMKIIGPTLGGIISGAVAGQAAAPDDGHNGHSPAQDYGTRPGVG